jgi:hypothetical protein
VTIHQYFDHNGSRVLAGSLRRQGFGVTTAQQLGLEQATDAKQFLTAVERGWVMVTHNESHYEELHDAWHRWSQSWGVPRGHQGVVILPAKSIAFVEPLLLQLLAQETVFANTLFRWRSSSGWQTSPYQP